MENNKVIDVNAEEVMDEVNEANVPEEAAEPVKEKLDKKEIGKKALAVAKKGAVYGLAAYGALCACFKIYTLVRGNGGAAIKLDDDLNDDLADAVAE